MLPAALTSVFCADSPLLPSLHALAARLVRGERAGHTLQPTALLHEACLRLRRLAPGNYPAAAMLDLFAQAMRRALVDHGRRRAARRRADGIAARPPEPSAGDLSERVALALEELALASPRQAKVVELRFFAGMSVPETARCLGVTERTVVRDWSAARARLQHLLDEGVWR